MPDASSEQGRAPLTVTYRPLDTLVPYAKNARTHSQAQVEKLKTSLLEYGWTNPIAVAENGIIAGHGRLLAAVELRNAGALVPGLNDPNTAPVIDLGHLTARQRRAYILADNRIALDAGWDPDLLKFELEGLGVEGFDLTLTAFGLTEIEQLMASPIDLKAEWNGMPEFDQQNNGAFKTVAVHFKDQDAVDQFAVLISQPVTPKTRFVWFPQAEIGVYKDKRYTT